LEQNGKEESPARRGFPTSAEPAAPVCLEVRGDGCPLGFAVLEQALRRSALLDKTIRASEAAAQQGLDRARR
jgi:hypothetical protein